MHVPHTLLALSLLGAAAAAANCDRDTGATCRVIGCYDFRGPTDCTDGKCICRPGHTSCGGECRESEVLCCGGACRCADSSLTVYQKSRPSTNGCGAAFGTDLGPLTTACCNEHNSCYGQAGATQQACDAAFCACVRIAAPALASAMCALVRNTDAAESAFCTAQARRVGCACAPGTTGPNCDVPTYTADGCPSEDASHAVAPATTGAVRCCKEDACVSEALLGCFGASVVYAAAEAACSSVGYRLCTRAELESDKCCGSGCGYDSHPTWFDNCATAPCGAHGACTSNDVSYTCACERGYTGANCDVVTYTADGCPTRGTSHAVAPATTGAVRCCKEDACISEALLGCFGASVEYAAAEAACSSVGYRLCTRAELESDKCCGSGCSYDSYPTWFDNCAAAPCGAHGACTSNDVSYTCACEPGYTGANCDIRMTYTADGCLTSGTSHAVKLSTTGAVRCCRKLRIAGLPTMTMCASKSADDICFGAGVSFEAAKQTCASNGFRLCRLSELEAGSCCGTGCQYDSQPVWFE